MLKPKLELAIELLPETASAIRRAFLADSGFRELCADFSLARVTLEGFERRADAASRPEIAEYRDIICGLAADIADWLRRMEIQTPGGVAQ